MKSAPIFLLATCSSALLAVAQSAREGSRAPETVATVSGPVRIERLASLELPWGMAFLPDGRLLVTEKPGRLRIWGNGRLSEPVAGVPKVAYRAVETEQGGLLDVAVDPDFARNGLVYLSYAEAAEQQPPDLADTPESRFGDFKMDDNVLKGGAVARGRLDGAELRDVQVIWRQVPKTVGRGHFALRMVFAPDGMLFITSGERMRFEPAQSLTSNLGKVVRINRDGGAPPDNPFAGRKDARADIFSVGHRNLLSAAVNPASGQLFVLEMGPQGGDELNVIAAGKNYGWPTVSNGDNYDGSPIQDHPARKEFEEPVRSWTPVLSPSGMLFYGGSLFPAWRGHLLAGGLSSKAIIRLALDGARIVDEERIDMKRRIRDVIEAPDGALLALVDDKNGELLRLVPQRPQ
jgi:glucose/arabinose dehydrogenase